MCGDASIRVSRVGGCEEGDRVGATECTGDGGADDFECNRSTYDTDISRWVTRLAKIEERRRVCGRTFYQKNR
jgi:hypothetical protein